MQRFRRHMQNRYGIDQLGLAMLLAGALLSLVLSLAGTPLSSLPYLIILGISLFRAMSRNLAARNAENLRWLGLYRRFRARVSLWGRMVRERRISRYLRCPGCHQMLGCRAAPEKSRCAAVAAITASSKRYRPPRFASVGDVPHRRCRTSLFRPLQSMPRLTRISR